MCSDLKRLVKALDMAWDMELQGKSINFDDEFTVAPQVGAGISIWAKWVRDGHLLPYEVLWAFKDTDPKEWLAIRIHTPWSKFKFSQQPKEDKPGGEDTFYFNLKSQRDRNKLRQLENEIKFFLRK